MKKNNKKKNNKKKNKKQKTNRPKLNHKKHVSQIYNRGDSSQQPKSRLSGDSTNKCNNYYYNNSYTVINNSEMY